MEKYIIALVVLCTLVALPGCTTPEADMADQATLGVVGPVESTALGVSAETTIVTQTTATQTTVLQTTTPTPPSTPLASVDILANMKKPCSAVAADAPKFVTPETATK